jgi:hypothetical protein
VKAHIRISIVLAALVGALTVPGAALAAGPAFSLHSMAYPTDFSAAQTSECLETFTAHEGVLCDGYQVSATNLGSGSTDGSSVTLTDTLPAGVEFKNALFYQVVPLGSPVERSRFCTHTATVVRCVFKASTKKEEEEGLPKVGGKLNADEVLEMQIYVVTQPGTGGPLTNSFTVAGGGTAGEVSGSATNLASDAPAPFGANLFSALTGPAGEASTQAGGHPFEFSTRLDLNSVVRRTPESKLLPTSTEDLKDAVIDLPPGLLGSAVAAPTCKFFQLVSLAGCPKGTQVGYIYTEPSSIARVGSGIFNMTPEKGFAAVFGYTDVLNNTHVIYASVTPGPEGYVVRATTPDAPQIGLTDAVATFFGDPAAKDGVEGDQAMFTNPSDCGAPLTSHLLADSWQKPGATTPEGAPEPGDPNWIPSSASFPPVSGCAALKFEPTIETVASTDRADSPSGLDVNIKLPQTTGFEELGTPPLKTAVVTLPAGMAVNPSSANGLGACSLAQVGISAAGVPDAARPTCPEDSKIGTVELETPLLPGILGGQIYVARQSENPFGSLLAIYIVVDDPTTGVLVKLAGKVEPDEATGQLTTVVDNSPQFPFSELRTHFFKGNRAALRTPSTCGSFATTTQMTPWSAPESGPAATPQASFAVSQAAGAGSCPTSPAAEPNHPSFQAGSTSPLAGAYAPFVLHGARADGDQPITQVNVTLPKGLVGKLAGIPYCPEAAISVAKSREHLGGGSEEISSPACPAASELGTVNVGAGAGPEPFYVTGHAYLAGPYKGGPLSVVIVSPAVAGPFDLGTVVVRAALQLNLETAQITAVSDPIPTILHGIPLDIRSISLQMSRNEFTLNPTNCEKTVVGGEAVGQFGSIAPLSDPFQVIGCRNLAFRPKLALSLKGPTRRTGHPAVKAVLTYPKNYQAYANVAYAQVGLPGSEFLDQGNLNKVCTQPQLKSASCPKSSIYGKAKAWTPLLDKPLEGPVYIGVGYGHKLPDLVADLSGQIRVLLHGKVDTDKAKGIRNTFEVVPDAPVSRFVLELKGGKKYGLLENSENICAKPQKAQVKLIAQNGIVRSYKQKIANSCGKKGKGKKGKGHKHKGHGKGRR